MNLKQEWERIKAVMLTPTNFFEAAAKDRPDTLFRDALRSFGVVIAVGTLFYFLVTLLNLGELQQQVQALKNYGVQSPVPAWLQEAVPWNRLLFPLVWLPTILYGGLLRHLFVRLVGEEGMSLARTQSLGFYGSIPLVLLTLPGMLLATLFPYIPGPGGVPGASQAASIVSIVLLLGGWIWHGTIVMKGARVLYNQNSGRSILTWLFAPMVGGLICCCLWFSLYFFLVGLPAAAG